MDESTQKSLSSAIADVLPDISASELNLVVDTLKSLGVETTQDFQFVQEADLLSVLRPIQARKLVSAWTRTSKYIRSHDFIICSYKIVYEMHLDVYSE